MQPANEGEERRPVSQTDEARTEMNDDEDTTVSQRNARASSSTELPPKGGPQLHINGNVTHSQINGNVTHSQVRQNTVAVPQVPMTFRVSAKEPSGTHRPTMTTSGSAQRKRSRVGEEAVQGTVPSLNKIQEHVNVMNGHIDTLQKYGQKGNTGLIRIQMTDCMRVLMSEITHLMSRMINTQDLQLGYLKAEKQLKDQIICLQEENVNTKKQVIELQMKAINKEMEEKNEAPPSYAQMVNKNVISNIAAGRQMPLPQIPQSVRHAPSECIILYKSDVKGEMKSKQEQESFRKEVKEALNKEEQQSISAIRPTRYGGHTLIFYSEKYRDQVYKKLKKKEEISGICENESKIVAPTKRVAKIVCKDVPSDLSIEQIKVDMYGKHNPGLQMVNNAHRSGKIYKTRLGLIFELSTLEMAAIQNQGWKIRCDLGRELRVEEFISLQQCYACCKFGHSAAECKAGEEVCRLCGKTGHAGKDCENKNNKEAWRCANCYRINQAKNLNLDTKHAAAQLHKCPVAQQQKNIRKIQLASTGVFTTPIVKGDDLLSRPNETGVKRGANGAQDQKKQNEGRRRPRSRSAVRGNTVTTQQRQTTIGKRQAAEREVEQKGYEEHPCVQRVTRVTQAQNQDGWQVAGRRTNRDSESSGREGRSNMQVDHSGEGQLVGDEEELMELMSEAHDEDNEEL